MITRTAMTDDDGSLTTGTIFNNAWKTALYDEIDSRWSRHTSTLTGAQNNLDVDEADLVLLNGASDGAFTGLAAPASPAKPGKITIFKNIHATSIVTFAHNSGSSSAGNKFFNTVTSGLTPVGVGGWIAYSYDDVNSRWNLVGHEQGGWITLAYAGGTFTATTGTWGVADADELIATRLSGRALTVKLRILTTDVSDITANLLVTLPYTFAGTSADFQFVRVADAGAPAAIGLVAPSSSTLAFWSTVGGGAWAVTTADDTQIVGAPVLEVT